MIRERGGTWQVRVYAGIDPASGKKRHLYGTATSKRSARLLEAELERKAAGRTPATATVDHLLDRWLAVARHAPSTRYITEQRIGKHVRPVLGARRVAAVTTEALDVFYLDLETGGAAPATVARLHGCLRAAFAQAVRWGWIEHNPAIDCTLPEVPRPTPVSPPPEQVRRLIGAAPVDLAAFLRLVAATGMRRGEACALRRSDIDLDAGVIRKARAISQGVERNTKTGARYGLAIAPGTREFLRQHYAAMDARAEHFGIVLELDCFVFSHAPDCAMPWRPDGVTQRFSRHADRVGLPDLRLKDLRDWMVTSLLEGGQSMTTVSKRAGHARSSTTLDHYAAWVPAADAAAADVLDQLLDFPPPGAQEVGQSKPIGETRGG
jgi:integrase